MDRTAEFRRIVKNVFKEIAEMHPSNEQVRTELVLDDATGHYQLGEVGWEGDSRVDDVFLHVDVLDGKVWIQHNGTDLRIADMFMQGGIPRENIVLAFHRPDMRVYTDFAVA